MGNSKSVHMQSGQVCDLWTNYQSNYPKPYLLPSPSGYFSVGCVDIMAGCSIDSVFIRLYYPTTAFDEKQQYPSPQWLPLDEYINGYEFLLAVSRRALKTLYDLTGDGVQIPAMWCAPIAENVFDETQRFPTVIFTHGLGANRLTYSTICCDIASHGFVVAAVEHRDGSASFTYCYEETRQPLNSKMFPKIRRRNIYQGQCVHERKSWRYLKEISYRRLGMNEDDLHLRQSQLRIRTNELERTLELLKDLNAGAFIENMENDFDLSIFVGKIDVQRSAIIGHSFGGATCIAALAAGLPFKASIVLDGWLYALERGIEDYVSQPLLFINTEDFQWYENVRRMKRFNALTVDRLILTIKGATHTSQTDFTFLMEGPLGRLCQRQGAIKPDLCNDINNALCLAFLRKNLNTHLGPSVQKIVQLYNKWVITGGNFDMDRVARKRSQSV